MAKFVFIYTGGTGDPGDEGSDAVMNAWMAWFGELGSAVVDGGAPFGAAGIVSAKGSSTSAGPSGASGYSVIEAADLSAALGLAKGCPILGDGGAVEVFEAIQM